MRNVHAQWQWRMWRIIRKLFCDGTYGGLFANQLLVALVADCLQSDLANGGYGGYGGLSGKCFTIADFK